MYIELICIKLTLVYIHGLCVLGILGLEDIKDRYTLCICVKIKKRWWCTVIRDLSVTSEHQCEKKQKYNIVLLHSEINSHKHQWF